MLNISLRGMHSSSHCIESVIAFKGIREFAAALFGRDVPMLLLATCDSVLMSAAVFTRPDGEAPFQL